VRSNVVGYVALFVALSGTAYAVDGPLLGKNTVGSADIINGEVKNVDIGAGAVTSAKVADDSTGSALTGADVMPNSLTGADIDESSLGTVPEADKVGGFGAGDFVHGKGTLDYMAGDEGPVSSGGVATNTTFYTGSGFRVGVNCLNNAFSTTGAQMSVGATGGPTAVWRDDQLPGGDPLYEVLAASPVSQANASATGTSDVVTWHGSGNGVRFTIRAFDHYDSASATCHYELEVITYA
jgi:hypothetical protein